MRFCVCSPSYRGGMRRSMLLYRKENRWICAANQAPRWFRRDKSEA
jgi:hypothetical protein